MSILQEELNLQPLIQLYGETLNKLNNEPYYCDDLELYLFPGESLHPEP